MSRHEEPPDFTQERSQGVTRPTTPQQDGRAADQYATVTEWPPDERGNVDRWYEDPKER